MGTCVYKYGTEPVQPHQFRLLSCLQCAQYLFPQSTVSFPTIEGNTSQLMTVLHTWNRLQEVHSTDFSIITNQSSNIPSVTFTSLCLSVFSLDHCYLLEKCCSSAMECCRRQIHVNKDGGMNERCPTVWDGLLCWEPQLPRQLASQSCPEFLPLRSAGGLATKECLSNATWLTEESGLGWTDYSGCFDMKGELTSVAVGITLLLLCVLFMAPSLAIFTCFKSLRKVQRFKLHINLLFCLMMRTLSRLHWEVLVALPMLMIHQGYGEAPPSNEPFPMNESDSKQGSREDDWMRRGAQCRLSQLAHLYFESCGYFAFLVEGVYLYRLIYNALRPPRRLYHMILFNWAFPLLTISTYYTTRILTQQDTDSCLFSPVGLEWLYLTPNLICVVINIFFLLAILQLLVKRFTAVSRDWINFKRSVKAVSILVPLFGLQTVFTFYRPAGSNPQGHIIFTVLAYFTQDTQGIWAAVVLCYMNREVRSCVKSHLFRSDKFITRDRRGTSFRPDVPFIPQVRHSSMRQKRRTVKDARHQSLALPQRSVQRCADSPIITLKSLSTRVKNSPTSMEQKNMDISDDRETKDMNLENGSESIAEQRTSHS